MTKNLRDRKDFARLALCTLFYLMSAVMADATTYYVDPAGNDTTGTGSITNPWRNPGRCFKAGTPVGPGDTCSVNDGTYTTAMYTNGRFMVPICGSVCAGQGAVNGTSTAPITFKSTNPLGAKLIVPSNSPGNSHAAIYLQMAWYIIDGFDIDGSPTTYQTAAGTSTGAIYIEGGNHFEIRNNKIHDVARTLCSTNERGQSGIYLEVGQLSGRIHHNLLYRNGRLRTGESGCAASTYQDDHGMYLQESNGLTIDHNVCYDTNRGYCIQFYHGTHQNLVVAFNTFAGHNQSADHTNLPVGQIILTNTMNNVTIANNIFYNPGPYAAIDSSAGMTATNIRVTNNLTDINHAILYRAQVGITESGSFINTNPLFFNVSAPDYHLTGSSPAIDRGTTITGLGGCVGTCDIGAYEFSGQTSSLQAPVNLRIQ